MDVFSDHLLDVSLRRTVGFMNMGVNACGGTMRKYSYWWLVYHKQRDIRAAAEGRTQATS